ncbi:hypothetical protein BKA82DRAFT_994278 [Pisolithus tinctorius]|uniref:Uncharacterized protein n=1 Tax=Pisolithus tinctorius Marx 270 TaxID=870435 RepID=A0A0C3KPJ8_PISTI|nr:hypothetical protein BKA82DRAFT_994278 [Pisolithus tinctorius]KIO11527.1 hypothetical protein M404DRAFT_994278 [Pisolithus tinctorius Marx 270]
MSTTQTTRSEEGPGKVEGSQQQTSPEVHSNVVRQPSRQSPHPGKTSDQPTSQLTHHTSHRSTATHDASTHLDAPNPVHTGAPAEESPKHAEASASSPTGQTGDGTRAEADHGVMSRAHTVSSPHSESHQRKATEASPAADKLHEVHRHNIDPTHISTTHPMPGLHSGTHEYAQTRYVEMLLALDDIPNLYKVLAAFFTWILLAGFILFPGTFATWADKPPGTTEHELASVINNVPLLVIAWVCTGIGGLGMLWLWWRWRKNYIWIVNRIFVPGLLNSLAGLISTLSNIYSSAGSLSGTSGFGNLGALISSSALSTIIVTGAIMVICALMVLIYQFVLIRGLRKEHDRIEGERKAGKGSKEV